MVRGALAHLIGSVSQRVERLRQQRTATAATQAITRWRYAVHVNLISGAQRLQRVRAVGVEEVMGATHLLPVKVKTPSLARKMARLVLIAAQNTLLSASCPTSRRQAVLQEHEF